MLHRFQELFASLSSHEVRYVVIGGIAAVLHGVPRATFDLDILIDPTPENAQRLIDALRNCGFGTAFPITPSELLSHEITIFKDKIRVDVHTMTPGNRGMEEPSGAVHRQYSLLRCQPGRPHRL